MIRYGGYHNMGPIAIPPLPFIIVLTDLEDGTEWQLSHQQEEDRIRLTDEAVPSWYAGQVRRYAAHEGPSPEAVPSIRLIVSGGRLGYASLAAEQGVQDRDNPRIVSRLGAETYKLEIGSTGWRIEGDTLSYEVLS